MAANPDISKNSAPTARYADGLRRRLVQVPIWALVASLVASAVVFGGTVWWKLTDLERRLQQQGAAEQYVRRLEERLQRYEQASLGDRTTFEERLKSLADRQTASEEQAKIPVLAPFPMEAVMRAIVEVVCIDNKDKDVYYTASGTVIDKSGLIVTNRHILVSSDDSLIGICGVGFTDDLEKPPRIEYVAKTAAVHKQADLAVLRIIDRMDRDALPSEFPAISLKEASQAAKDLNLGDPVFIGGYPDIGADTFTFTQGVVSGRLGNEYIKTSALIDTGASGGAGFDARGTYIGVPTAAAKGEIGGSLGYLIGADIVDAFIVDYLGKAKP